MTPIQSAAVARVYADLLAMDCTPLGLYSGFIPTAPVVVYLTATGRKAGVHVMPDGSTTLVPFGCEPAPEGAELLIDWREQAEGAA